MMHKWKNYTYLDLYGCMDKGYAVRITPRPCCLHLGGEIWGYFTCICLYILVTCNRTTQLKQCGNSYSSWTFSFLSLAPLCRQRPRTPCLLKGLKYFMEPGRQSGPDSVIHPL